MIRRNSTEERAAENTSPPADGTPPAGKKGRPTPKRREAEQARKQRVKPALTRREQLKRDRMRMKEQRQRTRSAMAKGDERHFLKRDQGDVRRFIRNYVDSKRTIAEFFLPIVLVILVASFVPVAIVQIFATTLMLVTMLMMIFDLAMMSFRVKREVRRRFPEDTQRGHGFYAVARTAQLRRLRLPKPNVRPGDTV